MSNLYSVPIIEKCIEHLQMWMVNNPKYSCEFKGKAMYKDKLYAALLHIKEHGHINVLPKDGSSSVDVQT